MKRADLFTKAMLAAIAAGLWLLILRPVFAPSEVRAAAQKKPPVAKVIRAARFEVADPKGRVAGVLEATSGGPALALRDKDGKTRVILNVVPDGSPRLGLLDKDGNPFVFLGVTPDGRPFLTVYGKDGKGRAMLTELPDGSPRLDLLDKDGNVLWKAP